MRQDTVMQKEVAIGGFRYLITHPDPETAYKMGIKLMKLIAEPLASMAKSSGDPNKAGDAMGDAIHTLLGKIEPDQMYSMTLEALRYVEIQGNDEEDEDKKINKKSMLTKDVVKTHFHGRVGSMLKLGVEAITFQQEDFSLAMRDMVAKMMETLADKA